MPMAVAMPRPRAVLTFSIRSRPMTGNCPSAELTTCSFVFDPNTTSTTVMKTRSSGNTAKKP